jgi:hypothetical protein
MYIIRLIRVSFQKLRMTYRNLSINTFLRKSSLANSVAEVPTVFSARWSSGDHFCQHLNRALDSQMTGPLKPQRP